MATARALQHLPPTRRTEALNNILFTGAIGVDENFCSPPSSWNRELDRRVNIAEGISTTDFEQLQSSFSDLHLTKPPSTSFSQHPEARAVYVCMVRVLHNTLSIHHPNDAVYDLFGYGPASTDRLEAKYTYRPAVTVRDRATRCQRSLDGAAHLLSDAAGPRPGSDPLVSALRPGAVQAVSSYRYLHSASPELRARFDTLFDNLQPDQPTLMRFLEFLRAEAVAEFNAFDTTLAGQPHRGSVQTSIHADYYLDPYDLAESMVVSRVTHHYGIMHWFEEVLLGVDGTDPITRMDAVLDGDWINFTFHNDTSSGYRSRAADYLKWLTLPSEFHHKGETFYFEIKRYCGSVVLYSLIRAGPGTVSPVVRPLFFRHQAALTCGYPSPDGSTVVRTAIFVKPAKVAQILQSVRCKPDGSSIQLMNQLIRAHQSRVTVNETTTVLEETFPDVPGVTVKAAAMLKCLNSSYAARDAAAEELNQVNAERLVDKTLRRAIDRAVTAATVVGSIYLTYTLENAAVGYLISRTTIGPQTIFGLPSYLIMQGLDRYVFGRPLSCRPPIPPINQVTDGLVPAAGTSPGWLSSWLGNILSHLNFSVECQARANPGVESPVALRMLDNVVVTTGPTALLVDVIRGIGSICLRTINWVVDWILSVCLASVAVTTHHLVPPVVACGSFLARSLRNTVAGAFGPATALLATASRWAGLACLGVRSVGSRPVPPPVTTLSGRIAGGFGRWLRRELLPDAQCSALDPSFPTTPPEYWPSTSSRQVVANLSASVMTTSLAVALSFVIRYTWTAVGEYRTARRDRADAARPVVSVTLRAVRSSLAGNVAVTTLAAVPITLTAWYMGLPAWPLVALVPCTAYYYRYLYDGNDQTTSNRSQGAEAQFLEYLTTPPNKDVVRLLNLRQLTTHEGCALAAALVSNRKTLKAPDAPRPPPTCKGEHLDAALRWLRAVAVWCAIKDRARADDDGFTYVVLEDIADYLRPISRAWDDRYIDGKTTAADVLQTVNMPGPVKFDTVDDQSVLVVRDADAGDTEDEDDAGGETDAPADSDDSGSDHDGGAGPPGPRAPHKSPRRRNPSQTSLKTTLKRTQAGRGRGSHAPSRSGLRQGRVGSRQTPSPRNLRFRGSGPVGPKLSRDGLSHWSGSGPSRIVTPSAGRSKPASAPGSVGPRSRGPAGNRIVTAVYTRTGMKPAPRYDQSMMKYFSNVSGAGGGPGDGSTPAATVPGPAPSRPRGGPAAPAANAAVRPARSGPVHDQSMLTFFNSMRPRQSKSSDPADSDTATDRDSVTDGGKTDTGGGRRASGDVGAAKDLKSTIAMAGAPVPPPLIPTHLLTKPVSARADSDRLAGASDGVSDPQKPTMPTTVGPSAGLGVSTSFARRTDVELTLVVPAAAPSSHGVSDGTVRRGSAAGVSETVQPVDHRPDCRGGPSDVIGARVDGRAAEVPCRSALNAPDPPATGSMPDCDLLVCNPGLDAWSHDQNIDLGLSSITTCLDDPGVPAETSRDTRECLGTDDQNQASSDPTHRVGQHLDGVNDVIGATSLAPYLGSLSPVSTTMSARALKRAGKHRSRVLEFADSIYGADRGGEGHVGEDCSDPPVLTSSSPAEAPDPRNADPDPPRRPGRAVGLITTHCPCQCNICGNKHTSEEGSSHTRDEYNDSLEAAADLAEALQAHVYVHPAATRPVPSFASLIARGPERDADYDSDSGDSLELCGAMAPTSPVAAATCKCPSCGDTHRPGAGVETPEKGLRLCVRVRPHRPVAPSESDDELFQGIPDGGDSDLSSVGDRYFIPPLNEQRTGETTDDEGEPHPVLPEEFRDRRIYSYNYGTQWFERRHPVVVTEYDQLVSFGPFVMYGPYPRMLASSILHGDLDGDLQAELPHSSPETWNMPEYAVRDGHRRDALPQPIDAGYHETDEVFRHMLQPMYNVHQLYRTEHSVHGSGWTLLLIPYDSHEQPFTTHPDCLYTRLNNLAPTGLSVARITPSLCEGERLWRVVYTDTTEVARWQPYDADVVVPDRRSGCNLPDPYDADFTALRPAVAAAHPPFTVVRSAVEVYQGAMVWRADFQTRSEQDADIESLPRSTAFAIVRHIQFDNATLVSVEQQRSVGGPVGLSAVWDVDYQTHVPTEYLADMTPHWARPSFYPTGTNLPDPRVASITLAAKVLRRSYDGQFRVENVVRVYNDALEYQWSADLRPTGSNLRPFQSSHDLARSELQRGAPSGSAVTTVLDTERFGRIYIYRVCFRVARYSGLPPTGAVARVWNEGYDPDTHRPRYSAYRRRERPPDREDLPTGGRADGDEEHQSESPPPTDGGVTEYRPTTVGTAHVDTQDVRPLELPSGAGQGLAVWGGASAGAGLAREGLLERFLRWLTPSGLRPADHGDGPSPEPRSIAELSAGWQLVVPLCRPFPARTAVRAAYQQGEPGGVSHIIVHRTDIVGADRPDGSGDSAGPTVRLAVTEQLGFYDVWQAFFLLNYRHRLARPALVPGLTPSMLIPNIIVTNHQSWRQYVLASAFSFVAYSVMLAHDVTAEAITMDVSDRTRVTRGLCKPLHSFYVHSSSRQLCHVTEVIKDHKHQKKYYTTNSLETAHEYLLYRAIRRLDRTPLRFRVDQFYVVNGVAGCGKTTMIKEIMTARPGTLVLSATKLGASEIGPEAQTIGAFMYNKSVTEPYDTLLMDEAYMVHWGQIVLAAAMASVTTLFILGDDKQLPYIDRHNVYGEAMGLELPKVPHQVATKTFRSNHTFRCPLDVARVISRVVGAPVTTSNPRAVSMEVHNVATVTTYVETAPLDAMFLTFTQVEKAEVISILKRVSRYDPDRVRTVHEAQGITARAVYIVRSCSKDINQYKLSAGEKFNPWFYVAITRATESTTYLTVAHDDLTKVMTDPGGKATYRPPVEVGKEFSAFVESLQPSRRATGSCKYVNTDPLIDRSLVRYEADGRLVVTPALVRAVTQLSPFKPCDWLPKDIRDKVTHEADRIDVVPPMPPMPCVPVGLLEGAIHLPPYIVQSATPEGPTLTSNRDEPRVINPKPKAQPRSTDRHRPEKLYPLEHHRYEQPLVSQHWATEAENASCWYDVTKHLWRAAGVASFSRAVGVITQGKYRRRAYPAPIKCLAASLSGVVFTIAYLMRTSVYDHPCRYSLRGDASNPTIRLCMATDVTNPCPYCRLIRLSKPAVGLSVGHASLVSTLDQATLVLCCKARALTDVVGATRVDPMFPRPHGETGLIRQDYNQVRPPADGLRAKVVDNLTLSAARERTPTRLSAIVYPDPGLPKAYSADYFEHPLEFLQEAYDNVLPGVSCQDYSMDDMVNITRPLDVTTDYLRVCVGTYQQEYVDKNVEALPRLRTGCPARKQSHPKLLLAAVNRRNFMVPHSMGAVAAERSITTMFNLYVKAYIDPDQLPAFHSFATDPISPSREAYADLVARLTPAKAARMFREGMFNHQLIDGKRYTLDLKPDMKCSATGDIKDKMAKGQVINSMDPCLTAYYSPLFKEVYRRLASVLKPNVLMGIGRSTESIEAFVNHWDRRSCNYTEADFSAYDKSLTREHFDFFVTLCMALGMEWEDIHRWCTFHVWTSSLSMNGVGFRKSYQTQSGDASTALVNTVTNMMVLAKFVLTHPPNYSMFMGDDSLFNHEDTPAASTFLVDLQYNFNLQSKIIQGRHGYFCGQYVLPTQHGVFLAADPIKRIEKLGNPSIRSAKALASLALSMRDLCTPLGNVYLQAALAEAVAIRTDSFHYNIAPALDALYYVTRTVDRFLNLFDLSIARSVVNRAVDAEQRARAVTSATHDPVED